MSEIVQRLRGVTESDAYALPWTFGQTCGEAADYIEKLEAALAAERAKTKEYRRSWLEESFNADRLSQALECVIEMFVDLVDLGHDPEREIGVVDARAALTAHKEHRNGK